MENELTQAELDERVAILKRFRTLLEKQREKFQEYLKVLEKQQSSIEDEDPSAIFSHAEIEKQVVASISNLQKVIVPMSELYKERGAMYNYSVKGTDAKTEKSVEDLQLELNQLQNKVLEQNQKNRILLKQHMDVIREQLANFNNPYKNNVSVYATKVAEGKLVAVEC